MFSEEQEEIIMWLVILTGVAIIVPLLIKFYLWVLV